MMKIFAVLLAVTTFVSFAPAAEIADPAPAKTGRLSSVRLLQTVRTSVKDSPDGLAFHFLVIRTPAAKGQFNIKETRDFLFAGHSYQEKTQAELGQTFEPRTTIDDAQNFLALRPALRELVPGDLQGALVVS